MTKALKMRYILMDRYLVYIHWLSESFGGPESETLTLNQEKVKWRFREWMGH